MKQSHAVERNTIYLKNAYFVVSVCVILQCLQFTVLQFIVNIVRIVSNNGIQN